MLLAWLSLIYLCTMSKDLNQKCYSAIPSIKAIT